LLFNAELIGSLEYIGQLKYIAAFKAVGRHLIFRVLTIMINQSRITVRKMNVNASNKQLIVV
jgi:hypothetical protein